MYTPSRSTGPTSTAPSARSASAVPGPRSLLGGGRRLDLALGPLRAQQHGRAQGGDEQDQLLAERVEARAGRR